MSEKIRIGICGSGFIAEHHCAAFSRIPQVDIVGMASILVDQAKELMHKYESKNLEAVFLEITGRRIVEGI